MNNSVNFSHFTDLLAFDYSNHTEIHRSEFIPQEKKMSVDSSSGEPHLSKFEAETEF